MNHAATIAMQKAAFYRQLGFDVLICHAINGEPHVEARPSKSFDPIVRLAMLMDGFDARDIEWNTKRKH